jgi:hypothetical protein
MSKVSEHFAKFHGSESTFLRGLCKLCDDAMGKMDKAVAGGQVHAALKAAKNMLEARASEHDGMLEECNKVIESDLQKLVPTNISVVTPDAPGVRAVPRAGQRSVEEAKLAIDPQFAKLIAVDEDENDPARL